MPVDPDAALAAILKEMGIQTKELGVQSRALQEIVRTQSEHSEALTGSNVALTKVLERLGSASRSEFNIGSGVVTWPTLGAILGSMFALVGLVAMVQGAQISAGITSFRSTDEHVRRWSSDHDRTFGPIVTAHAGRIDANCERIQLHLAKEGQAINCDRTPIPWPNGDRGGR